MKIIQNLRVRKQRALYEMFALPLFIYAIILTMLAVFIGFGVFMPRLEQNAEGEVVTAESDFQRDHSTPPDGFLNGAREILGAFFGRLLDGFTDVFGTIWPLAIVIFVIMSKVSIYYYDQVVKHAQEKEVSPELMAEAVDRYHLDKKRYFKKMDHGEFMALYQATLHNAALEPTKYWWPWWMGGG